MNNYQLYRTNTKLGGQVAWNMILSDIGRGQLGVSYFDVTPISPNVEYKYNQNTDCLRYSHQENVRQLYKEIKGQFYDACIDPKLLTEYPMLQDNNVGTYDVSLNMGCSRISFERYNKQFQLLCPLWLEDFGVNDTLKFTISVYSTTSDNIENIIATKSLVLNPKNTDRFEQYFRKYVDSISENGKIGDDVININIADNFTSIVGLDIGSGDVVCKDISELIPNLTERERPMMETDFMIIDNFHTGEMIAKQLFNFNLVFNIADLTSNYMDSMMKDDEFFIKVDVYKTVGENDTVLEKCSFDNDYSVTKEFSKVFDYLHDDRCIDNIRDNKLAPDICHWTLQDNENYIFNLYPGFATEYPMFYKDMPNYWETDVKLYKNALNWTNTSTFSSVNDIFSGSVNNPNFTEFNCNKDFVKYSRIDNSKISKEVKQNTIYLQNFIGTTVTNLGGCLTALDNLGITNYIVGIRSASVPGNIDFYVSDELYNGGYHSVVELNTNTTDYFVWSYSLISNQFVMFTNKGFEDFLTYKYMYTLINKFDKTKSKIGDDYYWTDTVKAVINNIIFPKFIVLHNSLGYKLADSPWVTTNEIYYVKVNNKSNIVIRYDGKIKPMFCPLDELVWYKVITTTPDNFIKDSNFKVYNKEQNQGFSPRYPSVGYFNLELITEENANRKNEYKWFNSSTNREECRVFNLRSEIVERVYSKYYENYYTNDELIRKVIRNVYPDLAADYEDYLISIYNAEVNYEYDVPAWDKLKERFDYIYTIKLKLK